MRLLCFLLLIALSQCEERAFQVTLENLSSGSSLSTAFGDLVWAVHRYANPLYNAGRTASPGLRSLAEDGSGQTLAQALKVPAFAAANGVTSSGLVSGPIAAGSRVDFGVFAHAGQSLSFATGLSETNDNFVAPSFTGIPLFDEEGNAVTGTFNLYLWDAGTEVDETPGSGPNQRARQSAIGAGVRENDTVALTPAGNVYPSAAVLARVTITAATTFRFKLQNTAKDTGLSPIVWAVSTKANAIFAAGGLASTGLTQVAQNGNPAVLAAELQAKRDVVFSGVVGTRPLLPGQSIEFEVPATAETLFSFVTMYGISNDRFYGSPSSGFRLFGANGPLSTPKVPGLELWDSGTALNEEPGRGATQAGARRNSATVLNEFGVIKSYLADLDGFYYTPPAEAIQLSVTGFGLTAAQSSFSGNNPNQNVEVTFKFSNMFKLTN
eukprot:TRINITY_DN1554_c0_g1_i1.p1 TRINITY_DN1554_c0_g1~~TRINITY_DN1554_c0_g1_i1.p1  ORF type:complete len:438 (-),score=121.77 TRINITY_DN1554_c0_g1_i1:129-1442(-)